MSYSVFAKYYDELTNNISYPDRARYFDQIIKKYHPEEGRILLDLACGTGSLSLEMDKLGYDVIGIDGSPAMLSEAFQKRSETGQDSILFLCQPMDELDLYGTIDAAICSLDSLNHITEPETLQTVFDKVSLFMNPKGLFVFDVNTVYKHSQVLGNNIFVYDCKNVYCVWQNRYTEQSKIVNIDLDFFEYDEENDAYYRSSESFSEKAYTEEELQKMLKHSGLEVVARYAGDTFEPVQPDTQRVIYVTVKNDLI